MVLFAVSTNGSSTFVFVVGSLGGYHACLRVTEFSQECPSVGEAQKTTSATDTSA